MKKLFFISLLSITFALGTVAQDKVSDLKNLFELMNSEKMIDDMMNNMLPMLTQQASVEIQSDDDKEKFEKYMEFVMLEAKNLSKKVVNEEMVKIYDKHFTHEEIKDMIKFYKSPTGKKMLEKTPEMTSEMMNSMMTKYMPEFQENLKSKLEELK